DRQYWEANDAFERAMSAIQERGWGTGAIYDREQLRLVATGVSAQWENRLGRVASAGRTLTQVALDVYGRPYTDQQITPIWERSEALRETLEGRLLRDGWMPAETIREGPATIRFTLKTPAGMNVVQHVKPEVPEQGIAAKTPDYQCVPSSA